MQNPYILLIIGELFFTLMSICIRLVSPHVPLAEIICIRSFVSVSALGILMYRGKISIWPNKPFVSILRGFIGAGSMFGNFYGVTHLPLGEAMLLFTTFPLFIVILSFIILGEKPTLKLIILSVLGWVGVYFILSPTFSGIKTAGLISLLGSFLTAVDVICIHLLSRSEHYLRIGIYFVLCAMLGALLFAKSFVPVSMHDLGYLVGAGLLGTGAIISITKAYGLTAVSKVVPLAYSAVVFAYIFGLILWNEKPGATSIVGSFIVIFSCIAIMRLEKKV